ncbi:hypothetical protein SAMN05421823_104202 [Catalinimonas alkaloidigena]|uniref:Uncharacterized protein n=1 Tax=Catalinimonas alkaloidigena TaxID=1075417 RepID=A0A1G9GSI4_9BACT|nr:hypothetical protein [Catalinimonas alkaloidigena]SDL03574.1 hypothetical protein SAMN05421823_104202 [Catalinimonas alkaloidigena]
MQISYSRSFLQKLEHLVEEAGYLLRYEKGNFRSGFCILQHKKVVIVNQFYSLEGKINCLMDIIRDLVLPEDDRLSVQSKALLASLAQSPS